MCDDPDVSHSELSRNQARVFVHWDVKNRGVARNELILLSSLETNKVHLQK